jgi:hypothetical protein
MTLAVKGGRRHTTDPLVREIELVLKPIVGPAREKAGMLVEHLARSHCRSFAFEPRGLGDAIRRLRRELSDADIRAGATDLLKSLSELYGDREKVV